MRLFVRNVAVLVATLVLAACSDSTAANGSLTATVNDPTGDTFGGSMLHQWDITTFSIAHDTDAVTLTLAFTTNVILPIGGDQNALVGYLELDVDQDTLTGNSTIVQFVTGVDPKLGADYRLAFGTMAPDSTVPVIDSMGATVGSVKVVARGKQITARIPLALLGLDDGFLNASVIVGNQGEPTDIAPNAFHLHLGGTGASVVRSDRVRAGSRRWPVSARGRPKRE